MSFLRMLVKIFLHKWIDTPGHQIWMQDDGPAIHFPWSGVFSTWHEHVSETLMNCGFVERRKIHSMNCDAQQT